MRLELGLKMRLVRRGVIAIVLTILALAGYVGVSSIGRRANAFSVEIRSEPAGAAVRLDDRFVGRTPVRVSVQKPGEYLIRVVKEGFDVSERTVRLDRETGSVSFVLSAIGFGSVEFRSKPPGAVVFLDGAKIGLSPLRLEKVAPGEHEVRIAKEPFEPATKTIRVESGKPLVVDVELSSVIERECLRKVEQKPDELPNYVELLKVLITKRDFEKSCQFAVRGLEAVLRNPPSDESLALFLSQLRFLYTDTGPELSDSSRQGLYTKTVETFQAAIEREPSAAWGYRALVDAYALKRDTDSVMKLCRKSNERNLGVQVYVYAAQQWSSYVSSTLALKLLQEAHTLDPESNDVRLYLACTYYAVGEYEKAREALLALRSRSLTEAQSETLDNYLHVVASVFISQGDAAFARKQTDQAIELWTKAIGMEPRSRTAYKWVQSRAQMLEGAGQGARAGAFRKLVPPPPKSSRDDD